MFSVEVSIVMAGRAPRQSYANSRRGHDDDPDVARSLLRHQASLRVTQTWMPPARRGYDSATIFRLRKGDAVGPSHWRGIRRARAGQELRITLFTSNFSMRRASKVQEDIASSAATGLEWKPISW